ncbi:MAG: 6-Phosphogluconate dehydrogenase, decarboxylating [Bacteroidota bacterium]|jgi:6-phosphogluconate dehydrogenase
MSEFKADFGLVGLGVMGRNLLLNACDGGFAVAGLDTDAAKVAALEREAPAGRAMGSTDTFAFVKLVKKPRTILLLVPAGDATDRAIADLLPHLEAGDLLVDAGNAHFSDTERRMAWLNNQGLHFMGTGVSGGARGARFGPSIMPGGNREDYERVRPLFEKIAARTENGPCAAWLGHGAAGHYVKMVHNGIEYGLMQLIAEIYDLLKGAAGLDNHELHLLFRSWNEGRLHSFLMEITAHILQFPDTEGPGLLLDKIQDKAQQKGTGKWTSQHALDLGIPIPTIDAAVAMRGLSALKQQRLAASAKYEKPVPHLSGMDVERLSGQAEAALYFAFLGTYAQGLHLLREASREKGFDLDLATIAGSWRGGCIIRAQLLEDILSAYAAEPGLQHLFLSERIAGQLAGAVPATRELLQAAVRSGIPAMALSATLAYFDAWTSGRLPLNLVQAQRDCFGEHSYERVDREGVFRTNWH